MSALTGYAAVHGCDCTAGGPGGEASDKEGSDRASDYEGTDVDSGVSRGHVLTLDLDA